ncbi:hypothetical protein BJ322DRAFT_1002870 [Thelephora terrestris]|uniref:Diaminopimelate epimerase-like protein n=1 Tax=Thelephora terrestris TaxID=56493 RepID=A0A9P6HGG1_9AGAM|nr:hypothetical protein BJ322DRAFT_1002870 [Thelephora terrestris]
MSSIPTPGPRSYPTAIANAFTQDPFGGNPAAIIFLDPSNTLTQAERQKLAKSLNQPIAVFLTPTPASASRPGVVSFEIQHFVANYEVDLCGHGTIAASKVVFDSVTNSPGFETHTLEFTTTEGVVISSRQVVFEDEEWFEIVLPAGKARDATGEEEGRILVAFARAMGKEPRIKYLGVGEPPFQHHLLVVFEESENIEHLKFVDAKALDASGFECHVVTTDSTSGKFPEDYITRMFAPSGGEDEDQVCGSANCTMGPYWAAQKGITELKARQVSERGGKLRVGVYGDNIRLRGQARVTSLGRLFL